MKPSFWITALACTTIAVTWPTRVWAMGSSPKAPVPTCTEIQQTGLKEWKAADLSRIPAPSADTSKYPYSLPLVFHIMNHQGKGLFSAFPISDRELRTQFKAAREVFEQCGIESELKEVHYWEGPKYLNVAVRSQVRSEYIGDGERCILRPTHRDGYVNVYFVDGVVDPINGLGRSHSIATSWFMAELPEDEKFVGTSFVTDYDRLNGRTHFIVTPHEIGHVIMEMGHTMSGLNLMADSAEDLAPYLTKDECERARLSRFVHRRN